MKTHFYTQDIIDICDNKHLSVDEIFSYISQKYPQAGKSSIYRNVEELTSKWELKKVIGAGKKSYFEKAKQPHIHLIDEITWEIIDIEISSLPEFGIPKNFLVKDFDIKIFGSISK